MRPENDDLYEAFAHGRAERASLPLLRPADAVAYLGEVRARALEVLDGVELGGDPLLDDGYVYGLVIQHEHQHLETMLQTLQLQRLEYPLGDEAAPRGARASAATSRSRAAPSRWAPTTSRGRTTTSGARTRSSSSRSRSTPRR